MCCTISLGETHIFSTHYAQSTNDESIIHFLLPIVHGFIFVACYINLGSDEPRFLIHILKMLFFDEHLENFCPSWRTFCKMISQNYGFHCPSIGWKILGATVDPDLIFANIILIEWQETMVWTLLPLVSLLAYHFQYGVKNTDSCSINWDKLLLELKPTGKCCLHFYTHK